MTKQLDFLRRIESGVSVADLILIMGLGNFSLASPADLSIAFYPGN